jgi:hypothetical protein
VVEALSSFTLFENRFDGPVSTPAEFATKPLETSRTPCKGSKATGPPGIQERDKHLSDAGKMGEDTILEMSWDQNAKATKGDKA